MNIEQEIARRVAAAPIGSKGWKRRAEVAARADVEREASASRVAVNAAAAAAAEAARQAVREAQRAKDDDAGVVRFRHIAGSSYFGSGGAWVRFVERTNVAPEEREDSGFIEGPITWRPVDRALAARIEIEAGDCIGRGRQWRSSATWDPGARRWIDIVGGV